MEIAKKNRLKILIAGSLIAAFSYFFPNYCANESSALPINQPVLEYSLEEKPETISETANQLLGYYLIKSLNNPNLENSIKDSIADIKLLDKKFKKYGERYNIQPELLMSLSLVESEGNHNSQSSKGAYGLTQLLPATAERLGVDYTTIDGNIEGAAKYLAELLEETGNNLPMALNRYNCGPKGVKKAVEKADSDDYFVYRYFFNGEEARNFPLKVLSALPYFGKQYSPEEGKIKDLSLNSFANLLNEEEIYAQADAENNYN